MAIENKVIDSMPLSLYRLTDPEYIAGLKAGLEEKHSATIEARKRKPVFFIEGVPSAMNQRKGEREKQTTRVIIPTWLEPCRSFINELLDIKH
jgi:hypothetical protein